MKPDLHSNEILTTEKSKQEITEKAAENSSAFLDKIINSIGDPIFVKNRRHKLVLVNGAYCRLVGRKKEDLLGKDAFELFNREEAQVFIEKEEYVFETGMKNFNEEIFTDSNRNRYIVSTRRDLYCDESGEKYIIGTIRDETRKKEAQLNLMHALGKEKELNDLKSKFISMVSHEYRTPLTSILSSVELIELFGDSMSSEEKQDHFSKIKRSVDFLTDMLNDVLLINRKESGRLEFNPSRLELIRFCKDVIKETCGGDEGRIYFATEISEKQVLLDEKLCKYILTNLISNAKKYSPPESLIKFSLDYSDEGVNFEISDQGIGIPEQDQQRLFDPFFRAHNVKNIPGSGLGLSIVRNCIELHNGKMSFKSSVDCGSTFSVWLPAPEQG